MGHPAPAATSWSPAIRGFEFLPNWAWRAGRTNVIVSNARVRDAVPTVDPKAIIAFGHFVGQMTTRISMILAQREWLRVSATLLAQVSKKNSFACEALTFPSGNEEFCPR